MTQLVEQVARAIATADGCGTDSCQKHMMDSYKSLAVAALKETQKHLVNAECGVHFASVDLIEAALVQ